MVSSYFRKEAREKLTGKWGKTALITLAYIAIFFVINSIRNSFSNPIYFILSIATTIIQVPLAFGLIISFVKLFNGEDVNILDFLSSGFQNFGRSWKITLKIFLKMFVPIIVSIVAFALIVRWNGFTFWICNSL